MPYIKTDNEALKEVGKGFIAFANLFTALSIINIYLQEKDIRLFAIIGSVFIFGALYTAGYKLITKGSR